jgi:hypothetical protein
LALVEALGVDEHVTELGLGEQFAVAGPLDPELRGDRGVAQPRDRGRDLELVVESGATPVAHAGLRDDHVHPVRGDHLRVGADRRAP